ncbi:hypothetical protein PA01_05455 [Azoarcus sp. PA01]|nr:hypothetical protein PA01_05455 [Azoarcus sp. PA01]
MSATAFTRTSARHRRIRAAARGLGWFSIGLGVVEVLMPRLVAGVAGMRGSERFVRACGVREIVTGIGILAARRPGPWMWVRVAGDAFDFAALGNVRNVRRPASRVLLGTVATVAALDAGCANALDRIERRGRPPVRDYHDRRGLPLPPVAMRGAARKDFEMPPDMATPALLAPWPPVALRP